MLGVIAYSTATTVVILNTVGHVETRPLATIPSASGTIHCWSPERAATATTHSSFDAALHSTCAKQLTTCSDGCCPTIAAISSLASSAKAASSLFLFLSIFSNLSIST